MWFNPKKSQRSWGWSSGEAAKDVSYNLPAPHNYRPINAWEEKDGAQYISKIVRQQRSWNLACLSIEYLAEGKKCEENILRQNNWDSIKGCDGSKWPRGTFCVNILLHFCIWALLRGLFSTVEINCWQDSSQLGISGSKPNIAKSSYLSPIPPTALAYQR